MQSLCPVNELIDEYNASFSVYDEALTYILLVINVENSLLSIFSHDEIFYKIEFKFYNIYTQNVCVKSFLRQCRISKKKVPGKPRASGSCLQ